MVMHYKVREVILMHIILYSMYIHIMCYISHIKYAYIVYIKQWIPHGAQ